MASVMSEIYSPRRTFTSSFSPTTPRSSSGFEKLSNFISRKKAENQVQLLENRIRVLLNQELKAKKATEEARKRAEALKQVRERRLKQVMDKNQYKEELEQIIREAKERNTMERQNRMQNRDQKISSILETNYQQAQEGRSDRKQRLKIYQKIKQNHQLENRRKREQRCIERQEHQSRRHHSTTTYYDMLQNEYGQKISQEREKQGHATQKFSQLEEIERKILARMSETAQNHREALDSLKRAEMEAQIPLLSPKRGAQNAGYYIIIKMSQVNQITIEVQYGCIGNYNIQKYSHIPPNFIKEENGYIQLKPIVMYLKEMGLNLEENMISYYSHQNRLFVHVGHDPLSDSVRISLQDASQNMQLKFRTRPYYDTINKFVKFAEIEDDINTKNLGSRRTKERQIGYIIEKVAQWRRLYNGIVNDSGETVKCSLDQAAQYIGISKKSLDDYLLQLRFGRRYGFNFHEHKHQKVGILRSYVKKYKQIETQLKELWPDKRPSPELLEELRNVGTPVCVDTNCCVPPSNVLRIPVSIKNEIE